MKQKLFIFLGLFVLIVVLIGLNAVSYTQKEKELDVEENPNRSTFNLGATGTRAFFDLLKETGRNPVRWQNAPADLLLNNKDKPSTLIIIGKTREPIADVETQQILQWVSEGGKLILIDREPDSDLVKTTANWNVLFNLSYRAPEGATDASNQQQMTNGINAARAVQPTAYTKGVNGVQTSAFATSVNFDRLPGDEISRKMTFGRGKPTPFPTFSKDKPKYEPPPDAFSTPEDEENNGTGTGGDSTAEDNEPPVFVRTPTPKTPPLKKIETIEDEAVVVRANPDDETASPLAPVVHLEADNRNILVDVPYGAGQIVFLSDPYIVSNGGINLVDNAALAINVVTAREGIIAFDEYHQGYGTNKNRLLEFFAGSPVIPVFAQIALIVGLIFFSQSRRFARAVPEPEPDRLSKLEYVSAMAELQQRTKGFDLAIENIYTDFRRRVARLVGVDAQKTRKQDFALLIVERLPDENASEIEQLMQRCEDVMHGDAANKKEVLRLTTRLRELESKLGLQRRKRDRKAV